MILVTQEAEAAGSQIEAQLGELNVMVPKLRKLGK